jgi:transposase
MKSENSYKDYIGIDIAKKTFDAYIHSSRKVFSFPNTEEGFETFKQSLKPSVRVLIVLDKYRWLRKEASAVFTKAS